jgi:hypothetical protein
VERRVELTRQIVPKVSAFCAAIAIEADTEALTAAATCFAIMYWADSLADRGDVAMTKAIQSLTAAVPEDSMPSQQMVMQARLAALQHLELLLPTLSRPDDTPHLIEHPCLAFLRHGAATRRLSQRYLQMDPDSFWSAHADEFAMHTITNIQTAGTVALMYALYRQFDPTLPSVATLLNDPQLAQLYSLIDAGQRVFDDAGDWEIDRGGSDWNGFHLNLFNQPDAAMLFAYLRLAGIVDVQLASNLVHEFQAQTPESRTAIVRFFAATIRKQVVGLPFEVQHKYARALILFKRIVESGYVNCLGDVALADS